MPEESRAVRWSASTALETGELPPIQRDPSRPLKRPRFRPIGLTVKVVAFAAVVYFLVLPLIPGFRSAADRDHQGPARRSSSPA